MKKQIMTVFAFMLFSLALTAQETYDIFTYRIPNGFMQTNKNGTVLVYEKKEGKEYCQLALYAATTGTGNDAADFNKAWDIFARNPQQGVAGPETMQYDTSASWHNYIGAASGTYNKKKFALYVYSFTKGDLTFFAAVVCTRQDYLPAAQTFIASIQPNAAKFAQKNNTPVNNNTTVATSPGNNNPSTNNYNTSKSSNRITKPTLTFNDGWTSTAYDDYVSIIKNGTEVRLIFADGQLDKSRPQNTSNFEPYYWDNVVRKYYRITGQVINKEKPQYAYGEKDIWMAPAADITSGKQGYVAMILSPNNGGMALITVFAPNKEYFNSNFMSTADFNRMWGYNKYNATLPDIIGEWKNSGGSAMEYYNVYTGNSAGMATAHVSDKFIFKPNGYYESEHTGTSTFQGALRHGKSNYSGTYALNDITLTATGRGAEDPGEFICYFEAVKYGFMLRLMNKKYSGINMILYKVK